MSLPYAVTASLALAGEGFTLRSGTLGGGANAWTGGVEVVAYSTCRGRLRGYKPQEIKGGIDDGDELVVLDPATVLVTPKVGDRIAPGTFTGDGGAEWRQVVSVYSPRVNGRISAWRLQVRK